MTQFNNERALKKGPLDTDGYDIFRYHFDTPINRVSFNLQFAALREIGQRVHRK